MDLDPDRVFGMLGNPAAVIDCFGILDDIKIRRYFELGCEVKGLGRGHVKRIKDEVRNFDGRHQNRNGSDLMKGEFRQDQN
jgi:hypothetical protein